VVRHKLVQDIVSAYKTFAEQHQVVRKTASRGAGERRRGGRGSAAAAE